MKIFYVDPQSYLNLAVYDKSLLSRVSKGAMIYYLCSNQYDEGDIPGVIQKPVFKYNKKKGIRKVVSYLYSLLKILKYAAKERPDVIHIQWLKLERVDYCFYYLIKQICKTKIVFTAHNILPHNTGYKYGGIYKKFYNLVDAIIVHDENSKKDLTTLLGIDKSKVSVIRHGVLSYNVNEVQVEQEIDDLRSRYNLDKTKLLLSVVGYQNKYKGTDELLRAWTKSKSANNNDNCALLIAGRCREFSFLDYLSSSKNIFVEDEFISTERLIAILKLTDILLLPYIKISQSGVLLTAIEYGTPFLVTNVGGLSEPLNYGDVGWVIPKCDVDILIHFLESNIPQYNEIKAKKCNLDGWTKVRSAYSWNTIGEKTVDLYKTITT